MTFDSKIIYAKICPYCGEKPKFVNSSIIYGKDYGMIYHCKNCDAYVGVHKDSNKPKGRLANKELRDAKIKAHFYFDKLWQHAIKQGRSKSKARNAAYKWLSKELNIDKKFTHIGMFDINYCNKVISLCKPFVNKIMYKN